MTLEAIGECSAEDREWASLMLDVVLRDPVSWMMDVSSLRLEDFKAAKSCGKGSK